MKQHTSVWVLLLGLGLACSGSEDTTEIQQVEPTDVTDSEQVTEVVAEQHEIDGYRRALEDALGPIELADPDAEEPIDSLGDGPGYDDHAPAPGLGGDVDKTIMPIVWGWAVKGVNQMQDGNTSGPDESGSLDHCTATPGSVCDNLVHSQALDLNYTSPSDFADDLLGRCGRFDSTVDNSWKPCVVPYGKKPGSVNFGKFRKWGADFSNCASVGGPLPQWGKDLLVAAFQSAVQNWTTNTEYQFQKVTDLTTADVKLYCDTSGLITTGKVAIGYPFGAVTPQYAANHVFDETCQTPPHDPLLHAHHFADFYYTYKGGRVGFNWDNLWTFLYGCDSDQTNMKMRAKKIFEHEIGHVMGFSHQQLPVTDVMYKNRSCNWALNDLLLNSETEDTLWWLDINNANPLQISDNDLSCHSPLGGGESGSPGVTD
jgi:hypothetical protein